MSKCLPKMRALHLFEIEMGEFLPRERLADTANPRISGNQLFLAMDTIRNYKIEQSETSVAAIGKLHLRHLLRFLEKEFKDTQAQYDRMKWECRTSWSMLWAFLPPGEKVYYHCQISGEQCYGIVHGCDYDKNWRTFCAKLESNGLQWSKLSCLHCELSNPRI